MRVKTRSLPRGARNSRNSAAGAAEDSPGRKSWVVSGEKSEPVRGVDPAGTLEKDPCATAKSIADNLPIRRKKIAASKKLDEVAASFFSLKFAPRPIPQSVRLDATEYEVDFIGDDNFVLKTDDYDSPLAQWVRDFEGAATEASQEKGTTSKP